MLPGSENAPQVFKNAGQFFFPFFTYALMTGIFSKQVIILFLVFECACRSWAVLVEIIS